MAITRFVRQYNDQSTDSGFQFEFYCDRCGTGYQTNFVPTQANVMNDVLDAAGNLLGGLMSSVASIGGKARSANWERDHDAAFQKAIEEVKLFFHQCAHCGGWVDEICWTKDKNRCKGCMEDPDSSVDDEEERPKSGKKAKKTDCPHCGEKISAQAKFCPECGETLSQTCHCPQCGTEASGKFCAECGEKLIEQ
jgi:hypothetical protein